MVLKCYENMWPWKWNYEICANANCIFSLFFQILNPVIHLTKSTNCNEPHLQLFIPRVIGMYLITGLAFLIYITKIPERWFVGKVDYLGHSHNLWHVFVLIALYYWHNSGKLFIYFVLIIYSFLCLSACKFCVN